jgi:hypothetical protein
VRLNGVQEVVGSNPAGPIIFSGKMLNVSRLNKRKFARIWNDAGNNSPGWLVTRP